MNSWAHRYTEWRRVALGPHTREGSRPTAPTSGPEEHAIEGLFE